MEELLLITLRIFFTILWGVLEGVSYWPFDFGYEKASERLPRWAVLFLYFLIGSGVGWVSVLILPSMWLHSSGLRIANLLIAPLTAGLIGVLSSRWFYRNRSDVEPKDHFLPGFLFSFAVAAVRFAFIEREV